MILAFADVELDLDLYELRRTGNRVAIEPQVFDVLVQLVSNAPRVVTKEELLEYLTPRVAKWWLPDDVAFVDEIPKTSVGKFSKKDLRSKFEGYVLPS